VRPHRRAAGPDTGAARAAAHQVRPEEPTPAMRVDAHLDAQVLNGEWRAWVPRGDEPGS